MDYILHPCMHWPICCSAQPPFRSWLKFIFPTSSAALTKSTKVRFFAWQKQASVDNKRKAATFIFCFDLVVDAGVELSMCLIPSPPRAHAILWTLTLIVQYKPPPCMQKLACIHGPSTVTNLSLNIHCNLLWWLLTEPMSVSSKTWLWILHELGSEG